eukprot:305387-Rhodomonas_salina.2
MTLLSAIPPYALTTRCPISMRLAYYRPTHFPEQARDCPAGTDMRAMLLLLQVETRRRRSLGMDEGSAPVGMVLSGAGSRKNLTASPEVYPAFACRAHDSFSSDARVRDLRTGSQPSTPTRSPTVGNANYRRYAS